MVRNEVIIVPVTVPTEQVNSLTVVIKKNNPLRVCLDTRLLLMSPFSGAKWFRIIDANHAFWQIKVDDESSFLTTFHTPFGRFHFLRPPYGICSSSEIFHRVLYEMFIGIDGVVLQIDDLLVYGSTRAEHDSRLRKVLDIVHKNNLTFLNAEKCVFWGAVN